LKVKNRRILLIGLDGFDPELTRRWISDGSLPCIKAVAEQGAFMPLRSTIPPFTYPAWSSLLTGVNPGRHGITDFAVRRPGRYTVEFINSTHRLTPTVFKRLGDAGKRIAAMGFPTTYPPEPVNGIMIAGFDSPLAFNADRSFCYPEHLWNELKTNVSAYTLAGIQELNTGGNWKNDAQTVILETIRSRTAIAEYLYKKESWDLFSIVFSESDTAAHHFWAAHDPESPRRQPEDQQYADFLKDVYRALDQSVGQLTELAGPDTLVLIVSDHGSGGSGDKQLSLNRLLETTGYFKYRNAGRDNWNDTANATETNAVSEKRRGGLNIKKLAALLPARVGEWIFRYGPRSVLRHLETRNRLANADLAECVAFSDELNYFPSVWLNDDRFPEGKHYSAAARADMLERIRQSLMSFTDPDSGNSAIKSVFLASELYHGPALEWIPDIVVIPEMDGNYTVTVWNAPNAGPVVTRLPEGEMTGRKGGSMNGSHRPFGVLIASQPPALSDEKTPCLEDIGASILDYLGLNMAQIQLDGQPLFHTMNGMTKPVADASKEDDAGLSSESETKPVSYSEEEAEIIRKRLEKLGYL
jgi:predicted AlkP superfamily phosphohydrolase/phosphomutase